MLLVPAVQSHVSRAIQSDRVPDIPVVLTVQFLNKVVAVVVYDRCPWFRQCRVRSLTRSSTSLVQNSGKCLRLQSSTELNDVFEAVLAYFSDSPARG